QGWYLHARLPMPDMLLTFFITASLALFWRMVRRGPDHVERAGHDWAPAPRPISRSGDWLAFYGPIGGAFWSKGAPGVIPFVLALVYAVATRRLGRWRDLHLVAGVALVAAVVAPWWIRQWFMDTAALRAVVVSDNLLWYFPRSLTGLLVTGALQHVVG